MGLFGNVLNNVKLGLMVMAGRAVKETTEVVSEELQEKVNELMGLTNELETQLKTSEQELNSIKVAYDLLINNVDKEMAETAESLSTMTDTAEPDSAYKLLSAAYESLKEEKNKLIREHSDAMRNVQSNSNGSIKELETTIEKLSKRHKETMDKLSKDSANAILKSDKEKQKALEEVERLKKELAKTTKVGKAILDTPKPKTKKVVTDKIVPVANGETIVRVDGQRAFSDDQVRSIRTRINVNKESSKTIAEEYNVNRSTIHRIANKSSYSNVE